MVGLGILLFWISVWAFCKRDSIQDSPRLLRVLPWVVPIPYLVNQLGWTIAEIGRQPWIVYGVMRTENGVSRVDPSQVAVSLGAFVLVYALLGAVDFYLLWSYARKGPLPENSTSPHRAA
jgi:cytochrome d ubiquinol oxidase subunit I